MTYRRPSVPGPRRPSGSIRPVLPGGGYGDLYTPPGPGPVDPGDPETFDFLAEDNGDGLSEDDGNTFIWE